jgi:hypothetical protein
MMFIQDDIDNGFYESLDLSPEPGCFDAWIDEMEIRELRWTVS